MPSFAGIIDSGPGRISPIGGGSLYGGVAPGVLSLSRGSLPGVGAVTPGGSSSAHATYAGVMCNLFGGRLFERIIVLPRVKDLKFILTNTQFPIEVWNTFHDTAQPLTAIVIGGSGGIVVPNPFTLPYSIGPKDSIIFQALMPSSGPTSIAQSVTFSFDGISGTDAEFTGSRILVFTVAPDWEQGIKETISYLTNVLVARDDSEQRRGLRRHARRGLEFTAKTLQPLDAAGLEALLWGWQHLPYGVPFWPDTIPLDADLAAGALFIPATTADRLFAVGGMVLLWADEFTFEALTITSVTSSSIGVSAPTQLNWKTGWATFVVPLFQGRIKEQVELTRLWSGADAIDITFDGEAAQIANEPAVSFAQFKGFDVLEIAPNWTEELKRQYVRSITRLDAGTGLVTVKDKGGSPVIAHELPWWVTPHSAVTALRGFMFRRLGQLVPFWCPTFDQDLVLALDGLIGHPQLTIEFVNYSRFFFPSASRRFLALIGTDGSKQYVQVTAASDNGNGTESLTLAANLTANVPAASTMVSFLTFSRLATDDIEIDWMHRNLAQAAVSIQELPREVPA